MLWYNEFHTFLYQLRFARKLFQEYKVDLVYSHVNSVESNKNPLIIFSGSTNRFLIHLQGKFSEFTCCLGLDTQERKRAHVHIEVAFGQNEVSSPDYLDINWVQVRQ